MILIILGLFNCIYSYSSEMEYTTFILILCDIVSYDPSSDVHIIVPQLTVVQDRVALFSPLNRLVRTKRLQISVVIVVQVFSFSKTSKSMIFNLKGCIFPSSSHLRLRHEWHVKLYSFIFGKHFSIFHLFFGESHVLSDLMSFLGKTNSSLAYSLIKHKTAKWHFLLVF